MTAFSSFADCRNMFFVSFAVSFAFFCIKKLPPLQHLTTTGDNPSSIAAGCGLCTANRNPCFSFSWQLPVQLTLNAHRPTLLFIFGFEYSTFFVKYTTKFINLCLKPLKKALCLIKIGVHKITGCIKAAAVRKRGQGNEV